MKPQVVLYKSLPPTRCARYKTTSMSFNLMAFMTTILLRLSRR
ncbi:hypothetical protein [Vibrio furnissii]|nr:hypothetical protein [Vibrio furnissii]